MKNSRKTSILITALTVACFVGSFGIKSMANSSDSYKSQGKIVFDNNTTATTDDIIFDSSDFTKIDTMITEGKGKLATSLNAYPNINVQSLDTFNNLSTAIDNLTSVPDVYYYDKATEGDSCARYIYEDGSYYPCNEYGEKTSNMALTGTITVVTKDDTTEPAAGETQLVKYARTEAANLSAGSAGYVDKTFILGSGSDNISYRNLGSDIYYLGSGRTFDISSIVGSENVGKYGLSNFLIGFTPPVFPSTLVWNSPSSLGSAYFTSTYDEFVSSYDNSTGTITITGGQYYLYISGHGTHTIEMTPIVYFLGNIEVN